MRAVAEGRSGHLPLRFAHLDPKGDLIISLGDRELSWRQPEIYQEVEGARAVVEGAYVLTTQASPRSQRGTGAAAQKSGALREHTTEVAFRVGPHDAARPLVIDPALDYVTYLGGSGTFGEGVLDMEVDGSGNAYLFGWTSSTKDRQALGDSGFESPTRSMNHGTLTPS